jgi:transposase
MRNKESTAESWKEKYEESQALIAVIEQQKAEIQEQVAKLEKLVKYYEESFRLHQHQRFGASSQKHSIDEEQPSLFDEVENTADPKKEEPAIEEITYTRRKRQGKREEDLSALPVETINHTMPEEERICPICGDPMHIMGHDIRRELRIIPAQVYVLEHNREIYACRRCEKENDKASIVKAPIPAPVIPNSIASPSIVAWIMANKYVNALPLYRQEQELLRMGVTLSRQTMANWVIYCVVNWLNLLYQHMKQQLLSREVLFSDDTPVQVLKEPGRKARQKSYMWLYRSEQGPPIIIFDYQETRSSSHPMGFLADFSGYLHADGYSGYRRLEPAVTISGCWSHSRVNISTKP